MPNFALAVPEMFVLAMTCVVLLVDLFLKDEQRNVTYLLTQFTLIGAFFLTLFGEYAGVKTLTFGGSFVRDPMGDVLKLFIYLVSAGVFLYSRDYLKNRGLFKGEYYVLGLFAVLGMMIMVSAYSFLTLYLGLELLSLSLYAMVAFNRDSAIASEAAMKYFVLGAIASGMLLYGMSILYGITHSLDIAVLSYGLQQLAEGGGNTGHIGLLFGLVFVLVGIAFKLGAVPFHMWVPDVYQGAPTSVTLFVSSAPKIAAFALVMRLLVDGLGGMHTHWQDMLVILAVLSIGIGNLVAIAQTNIKRMLAYSTIAHVGFILLGVLAGTQQGYIAAMFYTLSYALMSLGGFGVLLVLSRKGFEAENISDLQGLNERSPWLAFIMLLLMLSMIGIPGTVGFYAKLQVLQAIVGVDLIWLAVYAVVLSVIGAFYYLRVLKRIYFDAPEDHTEIRAGLDTNVVLSANGLLMLLFGIFPGLLLVLCTTTIGL